MLIIIIIIIIISIIIIIIAWVLFLWQHCKLKDKYRMEWRELRK